MEPMKPMQPMKPMEPMEPMEPMKPMERWWPADLGSPSSTGSQNDRRYAYFGDAHRLAIDEGGRSRIFDTGSHAIRGFAQQQGSDGTLRFETERGAVDLSALKELR